MQDLATIYPFDEEHLDAMLQAYEDVGIRCVFALQIADVPGAKSIPFWDEIVPADQRGVLSGAVEPFKGIDLKVLVRDLLKNSSKSASAHHLGPRPIKPGAMQREPARNRLPTFPKARSCRSIRTFTNPRR